MPSDGWFRKRSKFSMAPASKHSAAVPDGVAIKCASCAQIIFTIDFEKNLKVCTNCGFHHKVSAEDRIKYTVDEGSFTPFHENLRSVDALNFPEYQSKLEKGIKATSMSDGVRIGMATINRVPLVLGVSDFSFMGGSMGSVAGEKITRAMEEGIERSLPVVLFTASGGARMQEGLLSLMQMAKTSAAAAKLAQAKLPYIVVMADPNIGGVLASYASLGDIVLAEPGASIGLAGARVSAQASTQKPPAGYQTSEWQLTRGQIDQVVHRRDIPTTLSTLLELLGVQPVGLSDTRRVETAATREAAHG
jgi:acetyl-CoA carboxylase carboxyl transferase subunit beta